MELLTTAPDLNPWHNLAYEAALESLGADFYDLVRPALFPQPVLRFRNDALLPQLGLESTHLTEADFRQFFGQFTGKQPCLALRYHGHQFGQYNPYLGDGRGFLYGQVRGKDGWLYDFGTKGSGKTPHSQAKDGRLSLQGGIREVLAAESLHSLGIPTSRCLCLLQTGEWLERDNSPRVQGAMMVRLSRSHIRFGSFERLDYYDRPDLIQTLLNHVIYHYYPHLWGKPDSYALFYAELVERTAELVAHWMAVGFCHGVLNTDNMSIIGEGFDYGSYRFIDSYNPYFTAANFDRLGRYSYRNQPSACRWNLEMLQRPLGAVISPREMETSLDNFWEHYHQAYSQQMLNKLGFSDLPSQEAEEIISLTLQFLLESRLNYHLFFRSITQQFSHHWREDYQRIFSDLIPLVLSKESTILPSWCKFYHYLLLQKNETKLVEISQRLQQYNPDVVVQEPEIARIWDDINNHDNWDLFKITLQQIQSVKSLTNCPLNPLGGQK